MECAVIFAPLFSLGKLLVTLIIQDPPSEHTSFRDALLESTLSLPPSLPSHASFPKSEEYEILRNIIRSFEIRWRIPVRRMWRQSGDYGEQCGDRPNKAKGVSALQEELLLGFVVLFRPCRYAIVSSLLHLVDGKRPKIASSPCLHSPHSCYV